MAAHIAKWPLVIARDAQGRDVYLYQGSVVPDNITADEVECLVEGGFIEAVAAPAGEDSKPSSTKK